MWPFNRRSVRIETRQTLKELERLILGDDADRIVVNPTTALKCTTVHASVRILSESLEQLPLHLYRRAGKGRERASDHPLAEVLNVKASPWMTAGMFRYQMMKDLCTHGNAYAIIIRNSRKQVIELHRVNPDAVAIRRDELTKGPVYEVAQSKGPPLVYPFGDIFHLRWLSEDGIRGESPVMLAKEEIGLALGLQSYASRIFRNGGRPPRIPQGSDHRFQQGEDQEELCRRHHRQVTAGRRPDAG